MSPLYKSFAKKVACLSMVLLLSSCAAQLKELEMMVDDHTLQTIKEVHSGIAEINREISTEEEIQIGEQMIAGILGAAPLVENPALQNYVNHVGSWVARQSIRKDLPWSFGVIDSMGINAMAAPGGFIVITKGLVELIENEAQLAGVLAHEIEHVVARHHLIALKKSMKSEVWGRVGTLFVGDSEVVNSLLDAGKQLYVSGLDREYEYLADKKSVVLAARAGYDPYAVLAVLAAIDEINPSDESLTVLLKTHPPTQDRITRLLKIMEGKMDQYADGRLNANRYKSVVK